MKKLIIIFILLVLLTTAVAIVSQTLDSKMAIILLSGIKFLLLSFYFMELSKAHIAWRTLTIAFVSLFILIISIIVS